MMQNYKGFGTVFSRLMQVCEENYRTYMIAADSVFDLRLRASLTRQMHQYTRFLAALRSMSRLYSTTPEQAYDGGIGRREQPATLKNKSCGNDCDILVICIRNTEWAAQVYADALRTHMPLDALVLIKQQSASITRSIHYLRDLKVPRVW